MAEYIDREKTQAYLYNNMMWYDPEGYITEDSEKDKALWSLVNGVPTADVIEQEKIDKAIDKVYKIRKEVLYANGCYEPDDVLDIIDQITKLFEEI